MIPIHKWFSRLKFPLNREFVDFVVFMEYGVNPLFWKTKEEISNNPVRVFTELPDNNLEDLPVCFIEVPNKIKVWLWESSGDACIVGMQTPEPISDPFYGVFLNMFPLDFKSPSIPQRVRKYFAELEGGTFTVIQLESRYKAYAFLYMLCGVLGIRQSGGPFELL